MTDSAYFYQMKHDKGREVHHTFAIARTAAECKLLRALSNYDLDQLYQYTEYHGPSGLALLCKQEQTRRIECDEACQAYVQSSEHPRPTLDKYMVVMPNGIANLSEDPTSPRGVWSLDAKPAGATCPNLRHWVPTLVSLLPNKAREVIWSVWEADNA